MSKITRGQKYRARITWLASFQDNKCFFCQKEVQFLDIAASYDSENSEINGDDYVSLDHFIPRAKNGSSRLRNLVVAHRFCNSEKNHNTPTKEEHDRFLLLNEIRSNHPLFLMSDRQIDNQKVDKSITMFVRTYMDANFLYPETVSPWLKWSFQT